MIGTCNHSNRMIHRCRCSHSARGSRTPLGSAARARCSRLITEDITVVSTKLDGQLMTILVEPHCQPSRHSESLRVLMGTPWLCDDLGEVVGLGVARVLDSTIDDQD